MKATVIRTAMIGGGLSYDVLVTTDQIATYQGARHTTILRDGREFWDFTNATLPADHYDMELGWDRYQHYKDHEGESRKRMLEIVCSVFPEVKQFKGDVLPTLWICGLMPRKQETSATVEVEV